MFEDETNFVVLVYLLVFSLCDQQFVNFNVIFLKLFAFQILMESVTFVEKEMFDRNDDDEPVELPIIRKNRRSKKVDINNVPLIKRRDPRFDPNCGVYNRAHFKQQYGFVDELRKRELKMLGKLLKKCQSSEEKLRLSREYNRLKSQICSEKDLEERRKLISLERKKVLDALNKGKRPYFLKKSVLKLKIENEKQKKLAAEGKLAAYEQRKERKLAKKPRPFIV
ncbi:Ribosomal RNA processing protein 36 -like protein [Trichinella britovi]|uniref:rRNA biogenesis protein RRP36 n=1 Tax=Trichinella britovi TaxID=45882 RepID=A0A0V1CSJ5_TRIBR|nr:Ribosomal RNA processing protein 36 -like protein [Trichinella britovi]